MRFQSTPKEMTLLVLIVLDTDLVVHNTKERASITYQQRSQIVTFISHLYESAKLGKFGQAIMDVKEDGYLKKKDKHTSSCRIFPTV
jgi:hypothetical protein